MCKCGRRFEEKYAVEDDDDEGDEGDRDDIDQENEVGQRPRINQKWFS